MKRSVKYIKPGEEGRIGGEETDLSLILRAKKTGRGGKPTADAIIARNTLILRHENFIWMKVRAACRGGHKGNAEKWNDATEGHFAIGIEAFIRSIELFEPERGFALLTYAGMAIQQRVWRARNLDTLVWRPPKRNSVMQGTLAQWDRAGVAASLTKRDTGEPIDPAYLTVRARTPSHVPELIERLDREADEATVQRWMARLEPQQAEVLRMRFIDGLTLWQVGEKYDLTRERVRQIQNTAMSRLQEMAIADGHLVGNARCTPPAARTGAGRGR